MKKTDRKVELRPQNSGLSPRPALRTAPPSGGSLLKKKQKSRSSEAVAAFAFKQQRRAERKRLFRLTAAFFFLTILVFLLLAFLCVSFLMKGDGAAKKTAVRVRIEGTDPFDLTLSEVYQNGVLYLDFAPVASLCGFSSVSDSESVTYSFTAASGAVQTLRFRYGSVISQINGEDVSMSAAALASSGGVKIPLDYINDNIGGLSADYDEAERLLTVTRDKLSASTPKRPVYDEIAFFVQPTAPIPPIFATDDIPGLDNLIFKVPLTDYEDAMDPLDARDAYLDLVNREHALSADSRPTDLVDLPADYCLYNIKQLRAVPARALTALFLEAEANGIEGLKVRNGFLGYYDQSYFHEYYKTRTADIPSLAAPPGEAEYQTGLCVDMDDLSGRAKYEMSDFAGSDTFVWLRDNCWKFGFILRYPDGKESVTGYSFEPWHFRYVGRFHAYHIYTKGMCLEEYIAYLSE